jgi:hypothetical protein
LVLARFRHAVNATHGSRIERVVLFGSRARGEAPPIASDRRSCRKSVRTGESCDAGNIAKIHRGPRAQFARLAKGETRIDQAMVPFLGQGYELKFLADYGTGSETDISVATASAAVATATRLVECISSLLD